jgi:hypothetical protein
MKRPCQDRFDALDEAEEVIPESPLISNHQESWPLGILPKPRPDAIWPSPLQIPWPKGPPSLLLILSNSCISFHTEVKGK